MRLQPRFVDAETKQRVRAQIERYFFGGVPHNRAIGLELVDFSAEFFHTRVPFAEHLVGDVERGVMHGGVITAMMDATGGGAVMLAAGEYMRVVTLDLRIDYVRAAEPRRTMHGRASCYRVAHDVAFVRGAAFHADEHGNLEVQIAQATGVFALMRSASAGRIIGAPEPAGTDSGDAT